MAEKRKDSKNRNLQTGESERADGRYMYRFTTRNGRTKTVYAATLQELRKKEKEINNAIDNGLEVLAADRISVNNMFDRFIGIKSGIKPITLIHYQENFDKHVRGTSFGNLKLCKVRYSTILSFYQSLMDDKGCSFAVIQNLHSVLGQVFSLAVKDSIILNNPCYDVMDEFKKVNGITPKKRNALTYAEQHAFLEYVKNSRYNCYYWLFVCLFGTGLRLGELAGLTWNDIDFVKEIITVDHALNYDKKDGKTQYYIDTPKTKNGIRNVPMFPEVKEALKELRKENFRNGMISPTVDGYTDFIFLNSWNRLYSKSLIDYQLKKIIKSYNEQEQENAKNENREPLLMPHISAHIFRHTFATRLCESTKDIKVIQDVMGHGDVSTTMNIYASVDEAHKTEVFKGLEEKIKIC